ncbi:hypothetical protein GCM10025865_19250 [Paraoerskovia sediminicola]|uniref:Uncharacterized protein n=1 Tax=Paraoerskovia sediminicola TaxID=1138587 RepID=A0ABN6XCM5_9CELL|nr:hypothetical protein [Paraoerskovia sediminicola]BDZ42626.1 hypothetical protein GCM10025865_19250 [Paraoerskovia sediminicola]
MAEPGALLPLQLTSGEAAEELAVPVLDGTLPEYEGSLPADDA